MIGDARGIDPERSQLVLPGHSGRLVLEVLTVSQPSKRGSPIATGGSLAEAPGRVHVG